MRAAQCLTCRFIPTCVGSMGFVEWHGQRCGSSPHAWGALIIFSDCSRGAVHPHMRGEHKRAERATNAARGSSPHAWGACLIASCPLIPSVHPHMRGEHRYRGKDASATHGSSPHAWGAYTRLARPLPLCGSSPHAWGAFIHALQRRARFGSSPHAWGASNDAMMSAYALRFIPTCVGSIRVITPLHTNDTVHPHMRGEHL